MVVQMNETRKIKVVLFSLTGFGNTVLKALIKDDRVQVEAVFTYKYENPCPYYEERQLMDVCTENGVPCYHGISVGSETGIALLRKHSPDLILVATFKQILKENVLSLPSLGTVNFHPSLLPQYRGPCPSHAALLHSEQVTGITVHYVTEEVDQGNILLQRSIKINEEDNDGRLRQRLANLAGEMVPDVIGMFAGFTKPDGEPQRTDFSSYAPRPTIEDGYLELAKDVDEVRRRVLAFNPLPGTSILIGDRRITVDRAEFFETEWADGDRVVENENAVELTINSRSIRLMKKVP